VLKKEKLNNLIHAGFLQALQENREPGVNPGRSGHCKWGAA